MPPRRPYKKSILGCATCKRRRVKCDEVHPRCGQCFKHGVECAYSTPSPTQTPTPPSPLGPLSQPTVGFPSYEDSLSSRMMDLRLMHNCTAVAMKMSPLNLDSTRWKTWSVTVPSLAFQAGPTSPVLDLLLANSAVHLQKRIPEDRSLQLVAYQKFESGLEKMQAMTLEVNERNAPLLYIGSVLISLHVMLRRQEQLSSGPYSVPSDWFRAAQGTRRITNLARVWIQKSEVQKILLDPTEFSNWTMAADSPFAELLFGLEDAPLGCEKVAAYNIAVSYLDWAATSHFLGDTPLVYREKLLGFTAVVPTLLVELLEDHDPRTLAIFAHFFGLAILTDIWWLHAVAEREISGLYSLMPPEWTWAILWPLEQVKISRGHIDDSQRATIRNGSL